VTLAFGQPMAVAYQFQRAWFGIVSLKKPGEFLDGRAHGYEPVGRETLPIKWIGPAVGSRVGQFVLRGSTDPNSYFRS
jgi:hypothetical protein